MSITPDTVQAPIVTTTAGHYLFAKKVAGVSIANSTGVPLKVKFDDYGCTTNAYDAIVENNTTGWFARKLYKKLSVFVDTGGTVTAAKLSVRGEERV